MLRWIPVAIISLFICSVLSCGDQTVKEQGRPTEMSKSEMKPSAHGNRTLSGIVRQSPPRGMPPRRETSPGPIVPGARVSLRECTDKNAPAGAVLYSTVTDSAGGYELSVKSGTYFVTITDAKIPYPIYTKGFMGKNYSEADSIQFSKILTVQDTDQVLDIVLPQRWPE